MRRRIDFQGYVAFCPHCSQEAERYSLRSENGVELPLLGSPRRYCPHCGRDYFDGHYHEDALYHYATRAFRPIRKAWIFFLAAYTLAHCITVLVPPQYPIADAVYFLCFAVCIGAFLVFLFLPKRGAKVEARRQEQVERELDRHHQDDALARSLLRMANVDYLHYLIDHGVEVPEYFFRRLSHPSISAYPTPDFRQQAAREQWEDRQSRQRAHRKALEEEAEYYEYFLSLDTNNRYFLSSAAQAHMSPDAFRDHCKAKATQCRAKLQDSYLAQP